MGEYASNLIFTKNSHKKANLVTFDEENYADYIKHLKSYYSEEYVTIKETHYI